jgi:calcineurin-like phosphoesterase family protein
MNKIIKYKTGATRHWVGSDFHVNHNKEFIVEKRGFDKITDHNHWILNSVNALVQPDDILWYLGDGCLNATEQDFRDFFHKIKCRVHYIWGNHESVPFQVYKNEVFKKYGDSEIEVYPFTIGNITFFGNYCEAYIDSQRVTFTHYPFLLWNKSHHGSWNLSGHSHMSNPLTHVSASDGCILDCGVDTAKQYNGQAIFSWNDIRSIMKAKQIKFLDHHNERTT